MLRDTKNKKSSIIVVGKGGGGSGEQVQADWNQTDDTQVDYIKNKPTLATVATSGNYNDLSDKPLVIDTEYPSETLTFTLTGGETRTVKFLTQPTGYFYVEDVSGSDNTLHIYPVNENAPKFDLYYSTDEINWSCKQISYNRDSFVATVPANGRLYLKAITNGWGRLSSYWGHLEDWTHINCESPFNVGGNIMSLIYGNSFMNKTEFLTANTDSTIDTIAFGRLFDEANIVSAANLILPATTLQKGCYQFMFNNCRNLTAAPALPATTLSISCYDSMFSGCTSLTKAPALPAQRLDVFCYENMFSGCTSLTEAPELPAPRLEAYCYENMFRDCTSLNKVVCHLEEADGSAMGWWLYNVSPTGDFYNLGGATFQSGESGIPSGWTEHNSL